MKCVERHKGYKKKKKEGRKSIWKKGYGKCYEERCLLLYTSSYPLFTVNVNQSDIRPHMFNEQKWDIFMCGCVLSIFFLLEILNFIEFKTANKKTFGFMSEK